MPRPSRQTDQRLIEAAQALMQQKSLTRLNLRDVAKEASVNLGMFHYHFKTKDQFVKAVLQDSYDKFFHHFSLKVDEKKEPLEKLRQALIAMAQFSLANRHLVLSLLQDTLNGDKAVKDFFQQSMARHVKVILGLILQCQGQGSLPAAPLPMVMSYLMSASTGSSLVLGLMEHSGAPDHAKHFEREAFSEAAIVRRVNWVLNGLAAEPRPKQDKAPRAKPAARKAPAKRRR